MPVEISSTVILALKKELIDDVIDDERDLKKSIKEHLSILFEKLGINHDEASMFSLENYDVETWMSFYAVDVKDYIDEYYILVSEIKYYDSGADWEGPIPNDETLSKEPYYRFFHKKFNNDDEYIHLIEDKLILISSLLDQP